MIDYEPSDTSSSFPQEIAGGEVVLTLLPGQVFVTFTDTLSSSEIEEFLEQYQLQPVKRTKRTSDIVSYQDIGDAVFHMGLFQRTTDEELVRVIAEIRSDRRVRTASPVYYRADLLPEETTTSFDDKLLVHFGPHATEEQISELITASDTEIVSSEPFVREGILYQLRLRSPKQQDIFRLVAEFARSPLVRYVGPDWIQMQSPASWVPPDDPEFGQQWNLQRISAPSGWEHTRGSSHVIIAIIDSGCNLNHPDLVGKYVPVADRYDVLIKYPTHRLPTDPSLNENAPNDLWGHGTACAGVAAAETNNTIGGAGVAPNCLIMPIRLFDGRENVPFPNGIQSQIDIIAAINWAQTHSASVINMSWYYNLPHDQVDIALANAHEANLVLVAASGNCFWDDGCPNPAVIDFPASHWAVMAVGASDRNDHRKTPAPHGPSIPLPKRSERWHSKYGSKLSVMAPGIDCFTTHMDGGYAPQFYGTSAAAPHVAGLVALIRSLPLFGMAPIRNDDVQYIIEATADKVGGYTYSDNLKYYPYPHITHMTSNNEMGYGRINVARALIFARDNYTLYKKYKKFEEVNRDYAISVLILFGLIPGGTGVVLPTGGSPVPVDPGWLHLTEEQRDVLLGLSITELAKGINDSQMRQTIRQAGWDAIMQTAQRMGKNS